MLSRIAAPLLCAAAIAFACGPRQHANTALSTAAAATPGSLKSFVKPARGSTKPDTAPPLASSLNVKVKDGVQIAFNVTNQSQKKVELDFPSGQTHEFVVLDSAGAEVWRWSEGRMFTQAYQNKLLATDETATYADKWPSAGRHGTYTVVATLKSTNFPVEKRAQVVLP